ncbi:MAG: peptidylprolyl isomerase [Bacteroidetes bacterium]|nr:MAG: peptidylprolyl isomerase [Bacteroidota bacterium]RLD74671.1 MAG: peptidylprolyl isomerase [Bacteroidota bacterium]
MRNSFIILFLLILASCNSENQGNRQAKNEHKQLNSEKALEKANRYLVRTEKENIANYIRRHGLDMKETGSGLRYHIYEKGTGEKVVSGKTAVLNYTLRLLTGDVIYSSEKDGQKIFQVGGGNVESGLEEAILLMRVGDKAILILPAHLGYGLLGDSNKIPPKCTLVYDVELADLK